MTALAVRYAVHPVRAHDAWRLHADRLERRDTTTDVADDWDRHGHRDDLGHGLKNCDRAMHRLASQHSALDLTRDRLRHPDGTTARNVTRDRFETTNSNALMDDLRAVHWHADV